VGASLASGIAAKEFALDSIMTGDVEAVLNPKRLALVALPFVTRKLMHNRQSQEAAKAAARGVLKLGKSVLDLFALNGQQDGVN